MDVTELERQVEYKFAPGPLLAVQALANTYDFEDEEERLLDPETTRRWLVESDLAVPEVDVGRTEHDRLVAFRASIRALLEANLTGEQDVDANRRLGEMAAGLPAPLAVAADGSLALDLSPAGTVDGVIAQMLGIAFQAQVEDTWRRLKVCASDECRWAFYDSSKNRGGTWCQMEVCGNRVKNRRYRDRKARR